MCLCTGVHEQNCLAFGIPVMRHEMVEILTCVKITEA